MVLKGRIQKVILSLESLQDSLPMPTANVQVMSASMIMTRQTPSGHGQMKKRKSNASLINRIE
jgi:hypothetical protein